MNRFREEQLKTFFEALDKRLKTPVTIFLIGGGAVLITKHTGRMTKDLDTWMSIPPAVEAVWQDVVRETGINLGIEVASVAEAPLEMEARAVVMLQYSRLKVMTPSALDLLIMKIPRFSDTDQEDIQALVRGLKA